MVERWTSTVIIHGYNINTSLGNIELNPTNSLLEEYDSAVISAEFN